MGRIRRAEYQAENGFSYALSEKYVTITKDSSGHGPTEQPAVSLTIPALVFEEIAQSFKDFDCD